MSKKALITDNITFQDKMNRTLGIILLSLLLCLGGCREIVNPFEGEQTLAKVGKKTLRRMDVEPILPKGLSTEDSLRFLESYVDKWVRNELKVQAAGRIFENIGADIEQQVQQYRNSLLTRKLDQYCIDGFKDSLYTEKDVRSYYAQHKGEFTLDRAIVKGRIVSLPSKYRQKSKIKELLKAPEGDRLEDLRALCAKNGFALTEITQWTDFSELLAALPTKRNQSYAHLLDAAGVQELSDGQETYYFIITDRRLSGQVAPLERVEEMIRWAVINQRKAEIIKSYEDSIYNVALRERTITVNI